MKLPKFALSRQIWDALASWYRQRRSPSSWRDDIIVRKAKIRKSDRHEAETFRDAVERLMEEQDYSESTLRDFNSVFEELVGNAFQHGCATDTDRIEIEFSLSPAIVSLTVRNPRTRARIPPLSSSRSNSSSTGHGLPFVRAMCDQFDVVQGGRAIKIAMGNNEDDHSCRSFDGITYISTGPYVEDYIDKISSCIGRNRDESVILVLGKKASAASRAMRSIQKIIEYDHVQRLAVVVTNNSILLPLEVITFSKFIGSFSALQLAAAAIASDRQARKKSKLN